MNILETILDQKRQEVASRKRTVPVTMLRESPNYSRTPLSLSKALAGKPMAIIAEIKKASPSKNVIRQNFDPAGIAREYVKGGAAGISVLTDEEFFQGSLDHLRLVRGLVAIPLLRKDFIIDEYQLHESKAAGADAVLLIMAALGPDRLRALRLTAVELGLEPVVEVHTAGDIEGLGDDPVTIIGINNRDLATFRAELSTSLRLIPVIRRGTTVISESGISSADDLRELMRNGIHAALVGELLLRAPDPGHALRELLGGVEATPWSR